MWPDASAVAQTQKVAIVIDWTISVGAIIEIVSIICGGIGVAYTIVNRIGSVEYKVADLRADLSGIQDELKKLVLITTSQAVMDQRLAQIEKTVDELRHGQGFSFPVPKPQ